MTTWLSVHPADVQDRAGAQPLLRQAVERFPSVRKVFCDGVYNGPDLQTLAKELGIELQIVRRPDDRSHGAWTGPGKQTPEAVVGFVVIARRWVVERTFAWLCRNRRLSKDYEALLETSAAWCWWASLRILCRRLASRRQQRQPESMAA